MESERPLSPRTAWRALYVVHIVVIGAGVVVAAYALIPLRVQKMEVIYRAEGVPFAAGPEGVPPEKWARMSATELEIVEPMANWLLGVSAGMVALSGFSLCMLLRLSPLASGMAESESSQPLQALESRRASREHDHAPGSPMGEPRTA